MILQRTQAPAAQRAAERAAFTLMEVLVVAAILVVLAGVGGVVYMNYLDRARVDKARIDVKMLSDAVEAFKINNGDYPSDLSVLTLPQEGRPAVLEQSALFDPWGHPYIFEPSNRHQLTGKPRVYSQGPNAGDASGIIANW
jgi:general secretion pathway protein G